MTMFSSHGIKLFISSTNSYIDNLRCFTYRAKPRFPDPGWTSWRLGSMLQAGAWSKAIVLSGRCCSAAGAGHSCISRELCLAIWQSVGDLTKRGNQKMPQQQVGTAAQTRPRTACEASRLIFTHHVARPFPRSQPSQRRAHSHKSFRIDGSRNVYVERCTLFKSDLNTTIKTNCFRNEECGTVPRSPVTGGTGRATAAYPPPAQKGNS